MTIRRTHPCVVCNRALGGVVVIDGVKVVLCRDCETDRFRREEALRRARGASQ